MSSDGYGWPCYAWGANERSSRKKKRQRDLAVDAFCAVQEGIGEGETLQEAPESPQEPTPEERHEAAVKLGRLRGRKGGPARSAKLSAEQRREIAKKAAGVRWQGDTGKLQSAD